MSGENQAATGSAAFNYSDKELGFCENIANGMNKTQSAIAAGYAKKSAPAQATRLLKKDKIRVKIAELQESRRVKSEIEGVRVIKELGAIAFSDVTKLFDEDWQFKDNADLTTQTRRAIKSIQVKERKNAKGEVVERQVTARMHDKTRALDQLAVLTGLKMDDVVAIAALLKYGDVRRTNTGIVFDYNEIFSEIDDPYQSD